MSTPTVEPSSGFKGARPHLPWLWDLACRLVGEGSAEELVCGCLERARVDPGAGDDRGRLLVHLSSCLRDRMSIFESVRCSFTDPRDSAVTAAATARLASLGLDGLDPMIARLDLPVRAAILLVLGEGMTSNEVATALGVPTEDVHAWLDAGHLLMSEG